MRLLSACFCHGAPAKSCCLNQFMTYIGRTPKESLLRRVLRRFWGGVWGGILRREFAVSLTEKRVLSSEYDPLGVRPIASMGSSRLAKGSKLKTEIVYDVLSQQPDDPKETPQPERFGGERSQIASTICKRLEPR